MQQFKNGDEVENDHYKGFIVCEHEGGWLVDLGVEGYHLELDGDLRPIQLICDEAREALKDLKLTNFRFTSESVDQCQEMCSLLNVTTATNTAAHYYYNCDEKYLTHTQEASSEYYNKHEYPELNLKTGEVIPCDKVPSECIYEDDPRYNDDLTHHHKIPVESKGVDMTIESAYKIIAELRTELKEKKERIKEFEFQVETALRRQDRISAKLNNELKEKDAENVRLTKRNERLVSIRNIIYELTNAPLGHSFELKQDGFEGYEFDVQVRNNQL